MAGTKNDAGKPRMSLLDRGFLEGMARVLGAGAEKYGRFNYKNGIDLCRYLDAADRHLHAFIDGEDIDPETLESHLLHAGCSLMMAAWTHANRPERDDRYQSVIEPKRSTIAWGELPLSTRKMAEEDSKNVNARAMLDALPFPFADRAKPAAKELPGLWRFHGGLVDKLHGRSDGFPAAAPYGGSL